MFNVASQFFSVHMYVDNLFFFPQKSLHLESSFYWQKTVINLNPVIELTLFKTIITA